MRDDLIIATRRSDCPNEVSNTLAFPFVFRGALDVCATRINDEIEREVAQAFGDRRLGLGRVEPDVGLLVHMCLVLLTKLHPFSWLWQNVHL